MRMSRVRATFPLSTGGPACQPSAKESIVLPVLQETLNTALVHAITHLKHLRIIIHYKSIIAMKNEKQSCSTQDAKPSGPTCCQSRRCATGGHTGDKEAVKGGAGAGPRGAATGGGAGGPGGWTLQCLQHLAGPCDLVVLKN